MSYVNTARDDGGILIVDDNLDSAQSLAIFLQMAGNQVFVKQNGVEAIEHARRQRPMAAILDIGLQGMNGLELAEVLRRECGSEILLVALTGRGSAEDRRRSLAAGFNHHLIKPIDPEAITDLVAAARSAQAGLKAGE